MLPTFLSQSSSWIYKGLGKELGVIGLVPYKGNLTDVNADNLGTCIAYVATGTNIPENFGTILSVKRSGYNDGYQVYIASSVYKRVLSNSTWTDWVQTSQHSYLNPYTTLAELKAALAAV